MESERDIAVVYLKETQRSGSDVLLTGKSRVRLDQPAKAGSS